MTKVFLGITVIIFAFTLALVTSGYSVAKSKGKEDQEKSTTVEQEDETTGGKSWKHGQKKGAGKRVKSHFGYLDTDKDGKISHQEFMAPHENRFINADTDGDGYLTPEEYGKAWAGFKKKMSEKGHNDDN
jgi:hypothetical protein